MAEFEVDDDSLESAAATVEGNVIYNCSTSSGAAGRAALGPFGILVLADDSLSELTPIYFYIAKDSAGSYKTFFCSDLSRSICIFSYLFTMNIILQHIFKNLNLILWYIRYHPLPLDSHICRSSLAGSDVDLSIYGSSVPVLDDEKLTMRVLVS